MLNRGFLQEFETIVWTEVGSNMPQLNVMLSTIHESKEGQEH